MRREYWNYYTTVVFTSYYWSTYCSNCNKWMMRLDGFLALTSCSSIAAWALWKQVNFIWPIIIAISQVIGALKPYFPHEKRIKLLNEFITEHNLLQNKVGYSWYMVYNEHCPDSEINELIYKFRQEGTEIENKYLVGGFFPEKQSIRSAAQIKTEQHFNIMYSNI